MFKFPSFREERKEQSRKQPTRLYRNPIYLAKQWQNMLENGFPSSQADLARKLGISRARVTQVLRLLRLNPDVLQTVASLGDPLRLPIVTERMLRPIVNLPTMEQKQRIQAILTDREGHWI